MFTHQRRDDFSNKLYKIVGAKDEAAYARVNLYVNKMRDDNVSDGLILFAFHLSWFIAYAIYPFELLVRKFNKHE